MLYDLVRSNTRVLKAVHVMFEASLPKIVMFGGL
jgi:hypothetical protein